MKTINDLINNAEEAKQIAKENKDPKAYRKALIFKIKLLSIKSARNKAKQNESK